MASVATLTALFKEIYSDEGVKNLIPEANVLLKRIKFREAEKIGKRFIQPVVLTQEHGITYAASGAGAFDISTPIAHILGEAQVDGSQLLGAARMDLEQAAKAESSKTAFVNSTEHLIKVLMSSISKRLELSMLYGRKGVAKFSAVSGSGTTRALTVQLADWSAGIWSGLEGANLDIYSAAGSKLNTDEAVLVVSVDPDTRVVNVSGDASDLTAIASEIGTTPVDVFFRGAYSAEMYGLDAIITNTTTMFNINAGTYSMWKGQSYAAGGVALTMGKVLAAVGKAVARGLDQDALVLVNPQTFNNLNSDQAALRVYDASYKKDADNGFEGIKYHAQNGMIEIVSHPLVKQGEAFVVPSKDLKRIGATDLTFRTPGRDEELFLQLPTNAGFELRAYSQQAIFCSAPAKCVKITGIVNS